MSHFIGLCFGNYWKENLEKYDENIRVDSYIKYTKEEAIDEVKLDHARNYEKALEILSDPEISSELQKQVHFFSEQPPLCMTQPAFGICVCSGSSCPGADSAVLEQNLLWSISL